MRSKNAVDSGPRVSREALEAFESASKERGPLATSFFERMKKLLG